MDFHIYNNEPISALGVIGFSDEEIVEYIHQISGINIEILSKQFELERPKYEKDETIELFIAQNDRVLSIILAFIDPKNETLESYRRVSSDIVKRIEKRKINTLLLGLSPEIKKENPLKKIEACAEGAYLTSYNFDAYKSKKKTPVLKDVYFDPSIGNDKANIEKSLKRRVSICEKVFLARDLVNTPANDLTPSDLAKAALDAAEKWNFEIEVFDEDKIAELNMGAYLAVARASVHRPKFIIMRYSGDSENPDKKIGLVGKGLIYDTGGLSLKPSKSMDTMKLDMGGAAAVIGAIAGAADLSLKVNIVGVIAACENALSGDSYRPGDIITARSGKTIEVLNTDAEGRLTLADALDFVINDEKADCVIDLATLTGAALVGLGSKITALLGNNDDLCSIIADASSETGEKVCRLPLEEDYKQLLKTEFADIKNVGNREGGTITAALFLQEFVGEIPWVHLDIAGPVWVDSEFHYNTPGATGSSVRLLLGSFSAIWQNMLKNKD